MDAEELGRSEGLSLADLYEHTLKYQQHQKHIILIKF